MKPITAPVSAPDLTTVMPSASLRLAVFAYGSVCYAVGVAGLCWLIAATFGLLPFTGGPLAVGSTGAAIAFDLGLVAAFGLQHLVMARPAFKARWRRVLPWATERPTFTMMAGLLMSAAMFLWQPLPSLVWSIETPTLQVAIRVVAALGWAYLFAATFAINHFELFGLQQVWQNLRGRTPQPIPFVQRLMYRFDRHPIMSGMLVGLWCTPVMRLDHLVLAAGLTVYIVLGVAVEERDLVAKHGESYRQYRRDVGSLVPRLGARD